VEAQVQLEEDVLLALEVVVERGLRHPETIGNLAQRCLVVALLVEQLERDVEDALPRQPPPAPDRRFLSGRTGARRWRIWSGAAWHLGEVYLTAG